MPIDSGNLALKGLDDLFSTEEKRQEEQREQVQQIPIDALHPFTNHPFKVLDDEAMTRTVESIAQYGVLAPLIARPRPDGDGYEIISGHRRQYAAKLAGLDTLPVIVRQMSDDAAVILMVDSNLQREHILPSERAFAYKMKLDAIKNQGARSDLTSTQVAQKLSVEKVGDDAGVSKDTIRRFIRLTNLIPELLDMVDEKKISFNPAVELSYLDESQQRDFLEAMDGTQNAPSVSQAQQLKKMAQCGEFTYEKAFDILGQEKKSEQDTVTIKNDMEKEIPVHMTNFALILNDLAASFEGRNEYISRLCRYPLLILDDFGMERGTEYGLEQVFNVIDSRYRSGKPLIVTTNLTLDDLRNPEDTAHSRIYDRLLSMCVPVRFTGDNFRQEAAQRKMESMKKLITD